MNKYKKLFDQITKAKHYNYTMYIGLHDKTTHKPINYAKALKIVKEVCLKHAKGLTYFKANGSWIHPLTNNKLVSEQVIGCVVNCLNKQTIKKITNELIDRLNQAFIMVVPSDVYYAYKTK